MKKQTKPRSKANFLPPDFARITGRIKRLKECIAKHQSSPRENSAAKIAECQASIEKYKQMARDLQDSVNTILED